MTSISSSGEPQPATVAISDVLSESSTEHEVFSVVETYAQLLAASHTVPQAAVVLVRVRKHRSDHNSSVSLEEAYQYKRGRALGLIQRPPRPRGVPRALRTAPQRQQQQLNSTTPSSRPESAEDAPATSAPSTAAAASEQLAELVTKVALQEGELSTLRAQLERAVRLAEQASTDVALLKQELQQRDEARIPSRNSRKRKSPPVADIDPASLLDHLFTPEQAQQHVDHCFVSWRIEEDDVTVGWACINAVLTLLNHRLQQANDTHVRFLTSYPGMEKQGSDDAVNERCMGIDPTKVRYVVSPVSVSDKHWALIVWDNEERQLLLLDSLNLVNGKQGTRLRRLLMRGPGKAKAAVRVPVMQQEDSVSCGYSCSALPVTS
jgi:uncharacterized coiled-coil protein SlyX